MAQTWLQAVAQTWDRTEGLPAGQTWDRTGGPAGVLTRVRSRASRARPRPGPACSTRDPPRRIRPSRRIRLAAPRKAADPAVRVANEAL